MPLPEVTADGCIKFMVVKSKELRNMNENFVIEITLEQFKELQKKMKKFNKEVVNISSEKTWFYTQK